MRADTLSPTTEAAIWERVIPPDGRLTPAAARAILRLEFDEGDRRRMRELAGNAQEGKLTADEAAEITNYERVGSLLALLKSKAREVLKSTSRRL
jgi:hypothetical protein